MVGLNPFLTVSSALMAVERSQSLRVAMLSFKGLRVSSLAACSFVANLRVQVSIPAVWSSGSDSSRTDPVRQLRDGSLEVWKKLEVFFSSVFSRVADRTTCCTAASLLLAGWKL